MPRVNYDTILQRISIEDVAKRLGMELRQETPTKAKTLCPFHDDKTPSLLIDSSRDHGRQHFHCFACGAHGDAIDLVKEKLKIGFKDAVEWLSPGSLKSVDAKRSPATRTVSSSKPQGLLGLDLGYKLYQQGGHAPSLKDWATARHTDLEILHRAGYLYAPSNWLSKSIEATQDASERRERAGLLEDAFLVRRYLPNVQASFHLPLNNRYSDFFIGDRIVFPLYDEKSQLVGLGGRSVEQVTAQAPKYQFTRGFPKSTVLYRADHAFMQIQSEARQSRGTVPLYLCEGFLDALRFEALGMSAVAIMGSSISEQQVSLLRTLSDSLKSASLLVVVCFDRDEAGLRGAAEACLKLLNAPVECRFLWPTAKQLKTTGCDSSRTKDPDEYLEGLSAEAAAKLLHMATHPAELAVLAHAFGVSAEDTLDNELWSDAPRARRYRAFSKALHSLSKVSGGTEALLRSTSTVSEAIFPAAMAMADWGKFVNETRADEHRSLSDEYLNDRYARLNHARILGYMGSRRGELPCDEPRWERLDIAATVFNQFLTDRLRSAHAEPIGPYDAVWVPRSFGGSEPRLKMMPKAEDLIIQQYLLNEILTERWDCCRRPKTEPQIEVVPPEN